MHEYKICSKRYNHLIFFLFCFVFWTIYAIYVNSIDTKNQFMMQIRTLGKNETFAPTAIFLVIHM